MLPASQGLLWYWHQGRDDNPWYPSAKLFRQPHDGQWADLITKVVSTVERDVRNLT